MLRPPVYAVALPMVWCTDRLARAMDVGLLTERQARTAGERVWLRMDEPSR